MIGCQGEGPFFKTLEFAIPAAGSFRESEHRDFFFADNLCGQVQCFNGPAAIAAVYFQNPKRPHSLAEQRYLKKLFFGNDG